ncbi:DHHA1 domain-containing protein [Candidatus Nanosalina sp. VS9-1]|uniref:DHHA1 domain-containing protein n=1 Tax=Candidatus Nanosalina sp. VS9-1 TaxID=3388566 RepID=UPI0039E07005
MVEDILEAAAPAAEKLENFDGKIRLIGQYDADGINATAIAHEMLDRLGKEFEYEILKQLYEEDVERIAEEDEGLLLFVDIGSGQSDLIKKHIIEETDKEVIISDHHEPALDKEASEEVNKENTFIHMNPHFLGHDGGEAISAAGMTYLLAKAVDEDNYDLVQYALIGATGDVQKQEGEFMGLNKDIAQEAIDKEVVEKRKGLDLYGRTTKPLQKSLMYTTDPHLEGVSNNESGAIQLVKSAGLDIRENGSFRTLADLTEAEEKKLINAMIKRGYPVQRLLNDIYTLENGYEIDEFSTIINACGRLGMPRDGVKILLENDLELAEKISSKYGRKISSSLRYVEENKDNEDVVYEKDIGVIDGNSTIDADFIGTVTTITMSNGFFSSPVVMGVAEAEKEKVKISSRASKEVVEAGLNLGDVIGEICEELDGEGGGHNIAAGAKIPQDRKKDFIDALNSKISEEVTG